jgi:hypothetical protein
VRVQGVDAHDLPRIVLISDGILPKPGIRFSDESRIWNLPPTDPLLDVDEQNFHNRQGVEVLRLQEIRKDAILRGRSLGKLQHTQLLLEYLFDLGPCNLSDGRHREVIRRSISIVPDRLVPNVNQLDP